MDGWHELVSDPPGANPVTWRRHLTDGSRLCVEQVVAGWRWRHRGPAYDRRMLGIRRSPSDGGEPR